MRKKPWKKLLFMNIAIVVALVIAKSSLLVQEEELIIRYHYATYNTASTVVSVALAIAGVALIANAIVLLVSQRDATAEAKKRRTAEATMAAAKMASARLDTPEGVYSYLEKLRDTLHAEYPAEMSKVTSDLLNQLDRMNKLQANLEELFRANDISKLGEVRDLLQDIENAICMSSTKRLINYYIVGGAGLFVGHAEQTIADNRYLLGQAQGVLTDVAEFVNGGKSLDDVKQQIQTFRTTIQSFVKEEHDNETQFEKDFGIAARSDGSTWAR